MSKKTFVYIAICAVIIVLAFVIGSSTGKRNVSPQTPANVATYYCPEGAINAVYGTSSVALSLSDGRNMILPQTISGSGARFASGTIVFWSEGDNAFVTEGNTTTYSNCVAGSEVSLDASTTSFTDAPKTFSFSFPNRFVLSAEQGYSQDWSVESTSSGLVLAQIYIPKNFMPGTNFGDAKFTIGVSSDPDAISQCLVPQFGNMEKATTTMINDTVFTKFTFSDAGAGNFYDTTSYHVMKNGECYAIDYTIHSGNFYNYPTGAIKMFDEAKVASVFESMVQSFKFL